MGFSAEWLRLREPADHAARDKALLQQAMHASGPKPVIVDLGSGTGSSIRACAPCLDRGAIWHLVDHDADLLALAKSTLGCEVHTHISDLTALDTLPFHDASLVTASALLDLCGEDWLAQLASRLAALGLPFYAALSYDGVMEWSLTDPADPAIVAAFNHHQHGDKGFGPALGPDAIAVASRIFAKLGYVVMEAESHWRLGPNQSGLQDAFLEGVAHAAAEAGESSAYEWRERRRAQLPQGTCLIGHRDLLALPPEAGSQALRATT